MGAAHAAPFLFPLYVVTKAERVELVWVPSCISALTTVLSPGGATGTMYTR
jgi:hypothetical protein